MNPIAKLDFDSMICGIIAIPRFSNGDYLLARNPCAPRLGCSLEFSRYGVAKGESPEFKVRRKLLADTGFRVDAEDVMCVGCLGTDTASSAGVCRVYLLDIPVAAAHGRATDMLVRITPTELRQLIRDNHIFDAQTLGAYALLQAQQ